VTKAAVPREAEGLDGGSDGGVLPPMDVAARMPRLVELLPGAGCEALIVTKRENVRYLTGFTGSAGVLVVSPTRGVLLTDGRYAEQAPVELTAAGLGSGAYEVDTVVTRSTTPTAATVVSGVKTVGFEGEHLSWARHRSLEEEIAGSDLVATSGLVEGLRRVKDSGEVARIEAAARVADASLTDLRQLLVECPEEREVALALDHRMRERGASDSSFETIVASGRRAAMPHARPSSARIVPGELIVLDFGAIVGGYHSDMTRTLCVGPPGSFLLERVVSVVAESQRAGVAATRPGAAGREVDGACRQVITDAAWGEKFLHGTGHGVGLEIHEAPRVSSDSTDMLVPGTVLTIEPGVYLAGRGGARIEDTVVVTEDGCRALTRSPKDLVVT
jgi:Xaa-Pro aminopeptidase